jgi:hypothetical protein
MKINVEEKRTRETEEKCGRNASLRVKNGPAKSGVMRPASPSVSQ